MNTLSEVELAEARRNTYALLSRLYLNGIVDDLLPYIEAIPELKAALASVPPSDYAAWHYDLFGLLIQPYESFFLSAENLVGGNIADEVQAAYGHAHVQIAPTASYGPDHIGAELQFLATLCSLEIDALDGPDQNRVHALRIQQIRFMDSHVLRWFLPFATAIQQQGNEFFIGVTRLAEDLLISHRESVIDSTDGAPSNQTFSLPDIPGSFEDSKLDLETIAEWVCTPGYSGMYLSRHDIGALGRKLELPTGFQSRARQLHHLFITAGDYGKEQSVVQELIALFEDWRRRYNDDQSGVFHAQVWSERAGLMIRNLQLMAAALQGNTTSEVEI